MKKKMMPAAAMLYMSLMICACGGQNNGREELTSPATEADIQIEPGAENDRQESDADAQEKMGQEVWAVDPLAETMYVRADGCKIKKGPGEKYETAGTLVLLEELRVTGKMTDENGEEWYRISAPETVERGSLPEGDYYIKTELVFKR